MKNFLEELGKNGLAPTLMSGCAGFLIGTIVMGLVFHSWQTPKLIESASATDVVTTKNSATSSITTEAEAKAELERGVEIEGEGALNDIPEEYPEEVARGYDPLADFNYDWNSIKKDLNLESEVPYEKVSFTAEELKGRQGEIIFSKEDDFPKTFVAIPEIKVTGGSSAAFNDYGALLVTTIEHDEQSDDALLRAGVELYLYSKKLVEAGHQLTFVVPEWGGIRLVGPTDGGTVFSYWSSERWREDKAVPDAFTKVGHAAGLTIFYWGGTYDLEHVVMATTTSIELYPELASDIIEEAKLLDLPDSNEFYSNNSKTFDLSGWLKEGAVLGKRLETDEGAYYIIDEMGVGNYIITVRSKEIIVSVAEGGLLDFEESRLYHGLYFEDLTEDPEMVKIEGTDFTLSRATLESLIYLLEDSGTDWRDINAQNLNLVY